MNQLPFSVHTKRIPIWGLGCAGGAAGLARAYEYCTAFPTAKVLVLCLELCSLTFQKEDYSKSNLIGTSLFADGVACALVVGDQVEIQSSTCSVLPHIKSSFSSLLPHSEDIMGWNVEDDGLYVVFSKDIPGLIHQWLEPQVSLFLDKSALRMNDLTYFVAHPGGKKVLQAYQQALHISEEMLCFSSDILRRHGNMSSVTLLYVLKKIMQEEIEEGAWGLAAALGPGFSLELLLLNWS